MERRKAGRIPLGVRRARAKCRHEGRAANHQATPKPKTKKGMQNWGEASKRRHCAHFYSKPKGATLSLKDRGCGTMRAPRGVCANGCLRAPHIPMRHPPSSCLITCDSGLIALALGRMERANTCKHAKRKHAFRELHRPPPWATGWRYSGRFDGGAHCLRCDKKAAGYKALKSCPAHCPGRI